MNPPTLDRFSESLGRQGLFSKGTGAYLLTEEIKEQIEPSQWFHSGFRQSQVCMQILEGLPLGTLEEHFISRGTPGPD